MFPGGCGGWRAVRPLYVGSRVAVRVTRPFSYHIGENRHTKVRPPEFRPHNCVMIVIMAYLKMPRKYMIQSMFAIVMIVLIGCVEIASDGTQKSDAANNDDRALVAAPKSTPTPTATSKVDFVKCNRDYIEMAPDFLELYHRYMDRMCKELEKAKIAMECPSAREESEKYIEAVYWDFALSLSESEQLRFVTQINSAQEFLPDRPDICSPEWIKQNLKPTPTAVPEPIATSTPTDFQDNCSLILNSELIIKFEQFSPADYVLPVGENASHTLDLSEYYIDWDRVADGFACIEIITVLDDIGGHLEMTGFNDWENEECASDASMRCSQMERMIIYFAKHFGIVGKDRRR